MWKQQNTNFVLVSISRSLLDYLSAYWRASLGIFLVVEEFLPLASTIRWAPLLLSWLSSFKGSKHTVEPLPFAFSFNKLIDFCCFWQPWSAALLVLRCFFSPSTFQVLFLFYICFIFSNSLKKFHFSLNSVITIICVYFYYIILHICLSLERSEGKMDLFLKVVEWSKHGLKMCPFSLLGLLLKFIFDFNYN